MTAAIKQAVMLVGGRGERLGALTTSTPKPLLAVAGRPFIEYWLNVLTNTAHADIQNILLSCGYRAEQFIQRYDGKQWGGATIKCVAENTPAGTGGALLVLRDKLAARFFLLNGDSILRPDWRALNNALSGARLAALTLVRPQKANRYGTVLRDTGGNIIGFAEKPNDGADIRINGGVYAFSKTIVHHIAASAELPCSLEKDILPPLAQQNRLGGIAHDGDFIDIGTPEDFARAQTAVPAIAAFSPPAALV